MVYLPTFSGWFCEHVGVHIAPWWAYQQHSLTPRLRVLRLCCTAAFHMTHPPWPGAPGAPKIVLWEWREREMIIELDWIGYGSIRINTIFRGMNIHLPAILMFTRGTRFWHTQPIRKVTLLRVIPTMTFIHFVTGISSGILSGKHSELYLEYLVAFYLAYQNSF